MNNIQLMARFNAWANGRLYGVVSGLAEAAYLEDRGAFFGSIHNTLNHLLVVDRLWTGRIEGVDHGITALDQTLYDDLAALWAARKDEDAHLIALVDGLGERLQAPVGYTRIAGPGAQETRCDHILITLYNHQTHHRGQVHAMLTQAGAVIPPLDVIYFLDELGPSA